MPFFHVDDGFHGHKKLARLGIEDFHAIALWTVAGSWSSDNLEDGFVPDYIAARMHPDYKEFANALVRVGLWEEAEKGGEAGWQFHDWTGPGRNPSAEQVHKERAANAERQREFRSRVKGTKPRGDEPPEPPDPQGATPPRPPMGDGGSNGVTSALVTPAVIDPVPLRSVPFRSNEENLSAPDALFAIDESARKPRADKPRESDGPTAQTFIGEWLNGCAEDDMPTQRIIGRVGKELKTLITEGARPEDIRQGLADWDGKGDSPASLPSFVNGARRRRRQAEQGRPQTSGFPGQRPSVDDRVRGTLAAAESLDRELRGLPPEADALPLATVTYLPLGEFAS